MTGPRKQITDLLRQRVLSGLHLGLLHAGDRLPSVREIASELDASPRVVLAAYRVLAREGLTELRPRSGIYVAPPQSADSLLTPRQSDWLAELVVDGLGRGIPALSLPDHIRRCIATVRLRAVILECNRDQLWSMTNELASDYGFDATCVDLETVRPDTLPANLPPELAAADVLVTTAYHATEVRGLGDRLQLPVIVATMCTDLFAETRRLLEHQRVYYVVDDPRMAAKLHTVFSAAPGYANLTVLVTGRDDLAVIPRSAPVYLTRLARRRLAGHRLLARTLAEARVFTKESAREITAYLIRANLAALMVEAVQKPGADEGAISRETHPELATGRGWQESVPDSVRS